MTAKHKKTCAGCLHWGEMCKMVDPKRFANPEECESFVDVSIDNPKLEKLVRESRRV